MAYSEVVKNFNTIRNYMREFYVYGFKSRDEYTAKSKRSYDDEKRRLESWLGEYMQFRQSADGKNVFISIDSRLTQHNPLYKAWKAKSFTDGEITLHFILMDILHDTTIESSASTEPQLSEEENVGLSIGEITERVDEYLSEFENPKTFDESTIRKRLNKYISEGIVTAEKRGKTLYYKCTASEPFYDTNILNYFSEVSPCGVVGSFLLDKEKRDSDIFTFKHHYITGAMDSEVLCGIFLSMSDHRTLLIEGFNKKKDHATANEVVPLKIMFSVQSGRQYLMAANPKHGRIKPFRLDSIVSVKSGDKCDKYDKYREALEGMIPHIWGVSTDSRYGSRMEHVDFTVRYRDNEMHIPQRLEREKRCGTVTHLGNNTSRFEADVYDSSELMPWIRTFICRITEIHFSNEKLEDRFKNDIEMMYKLYGIEGGDAL